MTGKRGEVASLLEGAASELESAAAHLRLAAEHFRVGRVPPGCAHIVAASGHSTRARRKTGQAAEIHADHAVLPGADGS